MREDALIDLFRQCGDIAGEPLLLPRVFCYRVCLLPCLLCCRASGACLPATPAWQPLGVSTDLRCATGTLSELASSACFVCRPAAPLLTRLFSAPAARPQVSAPHCLHVCGLCTPGGSDRGALLFAGGHRVFGQPSQRSISQPRLSLASLIRTAHKPLSLTWPPASPTN